TGNVTGIDATVDVGYDTGVARFVHQIVIGDCPSPCSLGGDSGSLWVTNDTSANPVGLNFAGTIDGSVAVANKIGDVLSYFGVSVDGHAEPTASGGLTAHDPSGNGFCPLVITAVTASGNAITVSDACGDV